MRVVVAGDDPLGGFGLAALLQSEPEVAVVDQASLDRLAAAVRAHEPDAILWDLGLGPSLDAETARDVAAMGIPVLAVLGDESVVADLLAAGIRGIVARTSDPPHLVAALRGVIGDLTVIDRALTERIVPRRPALEPLVESLTPRELEVLHLIGQGLSNRAIAGRLRISEHTAKFHVNAILGKLGAQTRAEAVAQGARLGLLLL
ncbi:MAG TPA: response regulator transcription factor [Vicinamibacteria bacterium]|jgi:DNA-binding NarL/FixJ family response regulator